MRLEVLVSDPIRGHAPPRTATTGSLPTTTTTTTPATTRPAARPTTSSSSVRQHEPAAAFEGIATATAPVHLDEAPASPALHGVEEVAAGAQAGVRALRGAPRPAMPTSPLDGVDVAALDADGLAALHRKLARHRGPLRAHDVDVAFRDMAAPWMHGVKDEHVTALARLLVRLDAPCPALAARFALLADLLDHSPRDVHPVRLSLDDTRALATLASRGVPGTAFQPRHLRGLLERAFAQQAPANACDVGLDLLAERPDSATIEELLAKQVKAMPLAPGSLTIERLQRYLPACRSVPDIAHHVLDAMKGSGEHAIGTEARRELWFGGVLDTSCPLSDTTRAALLGELAAPPATDDAASIERLRTLIARADEDDGSLVASLCVRNVRDGEGDLLREVLLPDTSTEQRASALRLLQGLRSSDRIGDVVASLQNAPVAALHGRSRLALDLAHALLKHPGSSPAEEKDTKRAARSLLRDPSPRALAEAVAVLGERAPETAAALLRAAPPQTDPQPAEKIAAHFSDVTGLENLLEGAIAALPYGAQNAPAPPRALMRARPELWPPLLADAFVGTSWLELGDVDRAFKRAHKSIAAWADKELKKAKASSSTTNQREGAVGAAATAVAMIDLVFGARSYSGARGPLSALSAVVHRIGDARIAKNSRARNEVLTSLFRLASMAPRIADDRRERERFTAMLESAAHKSAADFAHDVDALASDVRRTHPTSNERFGGVRAKLGDAPGASGMLEYLEKLGSTFKEGVESESLARLIAHLENDTLHAARAGTLVAQRFVDAKGTPLPDDDTFRNVVRGWSIGARTQPLALEAALPQHAAALAGCIALDSDAPLDWQRAVDDIISCQSASSSPGYNRGMLNRYEDGSVRLIALRDKDGATLARAALRLVVDEDPQPHLAIVLDKLYEPFGRSDEPGAEKSAVLAFARERAAALGVPLLVAAPVAQELRDVHIVVPEPLATDYHDSKSDTFGGGIVRPTGNAVPISLRLGVASDAPPTRIATQAHALGIDVKGVVEGV
jgi:hypothetical protein